MKQNGWYDTNWYSDSADFPDNEYTYYFNRGGYYGSGVNGGLYEYGSGNGYGSGYGFRVVITVL